MKYFYLLLFFAHTVVCHGQKAIDRTFDKFPIEKKITTQSFFKIPDTALFNLKLYNDSLLVARVDYDYSDYHFSIYSLKNKRKVASKVRVGRSPGESSAFLSHGIFGDKLWVFDLMKGKILYTPISDSKSAYSEISMPYRHYYAVQPLSEKILIASGDNDSPFRFDKIDLEQEKIAESFFPYPENYPLAQKEAYESFMFKQPDGNKFFLANRHADYLELYDLDTKEKKVMYGPEGFGPSMSLFRDENGQEHMEINNETRFGYLQGNVTQKYMYLLLSGNYREPDHKTFGKSIYVFDWDGNPVKRLNLKDEIVCFAVSSDDLTLYVYNPATGNIETSKL